MGVVALKQAKQRPFGRDIQAQAIVLDLEYGVRFFGAAADANLRNPVGVTVFEGVAEQVIHHRMQVLFGEAEHGAAGHVHAEVPAGFGQQRGQVQAHVAHNVGQAHRCGGLAALLLQVGNGA